MRINYINPHRHYPVLGLYIPDQCHILRNIATAITDNTTPPIDVHALIPISKEVCVDVGGVPTPKLQTIVYRPDFNGTTTIFETFYTDTDGNNKSLVETEVPCRPHIKHDEDLTYLLTPTSPQVTLNTDGSVPVRFVQGRNNTCHKVRVTWLVSGTVGGNLTEIYLPGQSFSKSQELELYTGATVELVEGPFASGSVLTAYTPITPVKPEEIIIKFLN